MCQCLAPDMHEWEEHDVGVCVCGQSGGQGLKKDKVTLAFSAARGPALFRNGETR